MSVSRGWHPSLIDNISNAIHVMYVYMRGEVAHDVSGAMVTAAALALIDEPETAALIEKQLCCPPVQKIWRERYAEVVKINALKFEGDSSEEVVSSLMHKLGAKHD